ncbi:MAG TPA: hypothetical protein VIL69_08910 [Roseomonas sp.]|jgi:hypothetical protein
MDRVHLAKLIRAVAFPENEADVPWARASESRKERWLRTADAVLAALAPLYSGPLDGGAQLPDPDLMGDMQRHDVLLAAVNVLAAITVPSFDCPASPEEQELLALLEALARDKRARAHVSVLVG